MKDQYLKSKGDNAISSLSPKKTKSPSDSEASIREDFYNMPMKGIQGDGVDQMDNGFEMSQSEIIDFSQGVDSQTNESDT